MYKSLPRHTPRCEDNFKVGLRSRLRRLDLAGSNESQMADLCERIVYVLGWLCKVK